MNDRRTFIREYAATFIAIMLGVAFATVVLVGNSSLQAGLLRAVAGPTVDHNYVVTNTDRGFTLDQVETLSKAAGVDSVHYSKEATLQQVNNQDQDYTQLRVYPHTKALTLHEGKLPESQGEYAISRSFTNKVGVALGETVELTISTWNAQEDKPQKLVIAGKIVGYVEPRYTDPMGGHDPTLYGAPATINAPEMADTQGFSTVFVNAAGLTPDEVKTLLPQPEAISVRTDEEYVKEGVDSLGGGIEIFAALSAFVIIALVVTTMVVRNTYAITLTRRRRAIGLARCIGATRGQVFREAIRNAVLLSSVASITGIIVGVGAALGFIALVGDRFSHVVPLVPKLSVVDVVLPFVTGLVVAVIGSVGPAAAASRTSPLDALRPEAAPANKMAASIVMGSVGIALFGLGTLMMFSSSISGSILTGALGGVISFAGVVTGGSLIVPNAMRLLGYLPAKIAGVPGAQAISNAVQAPGKAAATVMALLVGVTLVTMTTVGAATVTETAVATVGDNAPLDATISSSNKPISDDNIRRFRNLDGVEKSAAIRSGMLLVSDGKARITPPSTEEKNPSVPDTTVQVSDLFHVIDSSYSEVSRGASGASTLQPGSVVLPTHLAEPLKAKNGDVATLQVGDTKKNLTVVVDNVADGSAYGRVEDFPEFTQPGTVTGIALRIEKGSERTVINAAGEIAEANNLYIQGSAEVRAMIENYIRIVVYIVVALLALSIAIAGIGIANTLTLSVLERKRETSLLRALGMTRQQMRGMYTFEALLFALIAVVIGAGLGILYGWLGVCTLVASDDLGGQADVLLTIPWSALGLMTVSAVVLGVVASVVPASLAVRTEPAVELTAV